MSDEQLKNVDPSEADTVVPNAEAAGVGAQPKKWQMPEPVFQQTSGYLPEGFEKRFPQPPAAPAADGNATVTGGGPELPAEPAAEVPFDANITMVGAPMPMNLPTTPATPPTSIPPIEPQPEFPDTLTNFDDTMPQSAVAEATPRKRGGFRAALIVIAILAALAFLAVFLAAVYFLFLLPSSEAGNF